MKVYVIQDAKSMTMRYRDKDSIELATARFDIKYGDIVCLLWYGEHIYTGRISHFISTVGVACSKTTLECERI